MDDYGCNGYGYLDGCLSILNDECVDVMNVFVIGSLWYMWLIGLLWWQKGGEDWIGLIDDLIEIELADGLNW